MFNENIIKYSAASLLFIVALILYSITLYPSIGPRDSSEFALASYILGVAHPSGYPLFVMIGKIFMSVPIGDIAARANMVSALFSALTVMLVFLLIYRATKRIISATVGALTLCFSYLYWIYSIQYEVFTMNSFFIVLMLYLLLLWSEAKARYEDSFFIAGKRDKYFYLFSFVLGLGLSHHQIILLFVPAFAYYILSNDNGIFGNYRRMFISFIVFTLGFMTFLYLPIRALKDPFLNWGDPSNMKNFLDVITRAEFGRGRLSVPYMAKFDALNYLKHISLYARQMVDQFTIFGILLGSASLPYLYKKKNRKIGVLLLMAYVMGGLFFSVLIGKAIIDHNLIALSERFYISSFAVFAILIGMGCAFVEGSISKNNKVVLYGYMLVILMLPVFLLFNNYKDCNMRQNHILNDLPINVLSSMPKDSVLYTVNDSTRFGIWYMQGVHGLRPDVVAIWPYQPVWYQKQLLRKNKDIPFLPDNIRIGQFNERCFYTDIIKGPFSDISNHLSPEGLIYRIRPEPKQSIASARKGRDDLLKNYRYRGIYNIKAHRDLFTKEVVSWYAEAFNNTGVTLQTEGYYDQALEMYGKAMEINPESFVAYYNSAMIRIQEREYMKAADLLKVAIDREPKYIESYKQLGILYANNLFDTKKAIEHLEIYISLNPNDKDAPIIRNYIEVNRKKMGN